MPKKPDLSKPWVREAKHWEPLDDGRVKCNLCSRRCVIQPESYGVCGVRYNHDGKLYTLVYGLLTAANVDPIEKKPLSHFHPGSLVMSISTAGCNFMCKFCLNWTISQARQDRVIGDYFTPEEVVNLALRYGADGMSYTYNEPTVFYEFMLDTAKLARKHGLFNTIVTNGYMTPEAIQKLAPYLNAATVDIKGNADPSFYRKFMGVNDPSPIFDALLELKKHGVFIEVTDLVVPRYGESEGALRKLASWIVDNLGPDTPFHVLRFHPDFLMRDVPSTPLRTLEKHAEIAKECGLNYVYVGNVPGHPLEHTYCPKCGTLLVRRYGFDIIEWNLSEDNRCPKCGHKINIIGKYKRRPRHLLWW